MQIQSYDYFRKQVNKVQDYVTKPKYFYKCDFDSRSKFIDHFTLQNWCKLSETERNRHELENCKPCSTSHLSFSSLHRSSESKIGLEKICKEFVDNVGNTLSSPSSTQQKQGKKAVSTVLEILEPVIKHTYEIDFKKTVAEIMHLSPKITASEQNHKIYTSIKETTKQIETTFIENDSDVTNLLSSGKSYAQHDRERMQTFFMSKESAEASAESRQEQVSTGKKSKKIYWKI